MPPLSFLPFQTRAAGQAGQESHPAGRHQPPDATRLEASIRNSFPTPPDTPSGVGESDELRNEKDEVRNVQEIRMVEKLRVAGLALLARSTPNPARHPMYCMELRHHNSEGCTGLPVA